MKKKLLASMVVGGGLALFASYANAGWYGGDCNAHSGGGDVCIEYREGTDYWHMLGAHMGANKGQWVGTPPTPVVEQYSSSSMEDFTFSGMTNLSCFNGTVSATCNLALKGRVALDGNTVGIAITDGNVTGSGALCGLIGLGSFPWGIGPDGQLTGPWTGLTITEDKPTYTGSVGSIKFDVRNPILFPPYLVQVSNANIQGVVFSNKGTGPSSFTFSSNLLNNGTGTDTGCAIDGELTIEGDRDVDIYYMGP